MADERSKESPKSRSKLADFAGLPKKITALLEKESDRGAILIIAAYLEEILGLIIREAAASESLGDSLLEFQGPGGALSSKILICEAFALISSDDARALNGVRKIRNAAAHFDQKGRGFDVLFDSKQTIDQVRGYLSHLNLVLDSEKSAEVREAFQMASRLLAAKLYLRLVSAEQRPPLKSIKEYANEARERMKGTTFGVAMSDAEREAREGNPETLFAMFDSLRESIKARANEALSDQDNATK